MFLAGESLVIEPSHPYAEGMVKLKMATLSRPPSEMGQPRQFRCPVDDIKLRNVFWSWKYRTDIVVWESKGKIQWGPAPTSHHLAQDLHTMGCADAWSLETEFTALAKLRELVSHHHLRQYLLAGIFIETSKRTGIKYIFRRLRPTVAIREEKGELRILCCLCLHPIAYYQDTWAGAMCPTDDILAHLMLMRGDEPMFWKRSNQISAHRPEAGL